MKILQHGGRPRSEDTRKAILSAAYEILIEDGFPEVTMDKVAARAKASKATLYRWWPSKAALLLEAVHEQPNRYPRFADSGDVREDILSEVQGVIDFYNTAAGGAMLDLIAQSRHDTALADAIRDRFIIGRRADTAQVLSNGIRQDQIRPNADMEVLIDAIWGAIYYRMLVFHMPFSGAYAERLVSAIWPALEHMQRRQGVEIVPE